MSVDYLSGCRPYVPATPFRKWVESALPGVYDESLSLYELMAKLLKSFGDVVESVDGMGETSNGLLLAFTTLKAAMDKATADMDVENRVKEALERAGEDGTIEDIVRMVVDEMGVDVDVDPTLTKEGKAADAMATGDALRKKVEIAGVNTAVETALLRAKANGDFKGEPGDAGGHYTPSVRQDDNMLFISFAKSKPDMPTIPTAVVELPSGSDSGQNPPQDGEDGFSPVATVTQTANGAVISITDKNGTTTATVTNGKDGGNGKDGYTPVRGVDYWTSADVTNIKGYVEDAILGGVW